MFSPFPTSPSSPARAIATLFGGCLAAVTVIAIVVFG